ALELDAIVVTGTVGETRARTVGNSVATVAAAKRNEIAPVTDVQNLIQGAVPGVRLLRASGEVGAGGAIRIRGAGSMSLVSEPLLYVDGVRVNNNPSDGGGIGSDGGQPPSRINDINPDDIESIEIIKGPAAATLYGTEASNGVIQIITKRGRSGATVINAYAKQGSAWLPNPEQLFPSTYFTCRGTSGTCQAGEVVEFNVLRSERQRGMGPWFQTGRPRSFGANIGGGTDQVRYYFSGDYDRDEGAVSYNWQNRLSGRANLSYTPSDKLDFNMSLGSLRSRTSFSSANQPITTSIIWSCPAPGCEAKSGAPSAVDGPFRGFIGYLPERFEDGDVQGLEDVDRTTFSIVSSNRPWPSFQHKLTVGGDFSTAQASELYRRLPASLPASTQNVRGGKTVQTRTASYSNLDYAATLNLTPLSDITLGTTAGVQYYRRENRTVQAAGNIFSVSQLETISAATDKTAAEAFVENKTFGLFFQEQVGWKNRVFLTGAVRGDDNSAFGKNFDFVVYPKFSLAWVASEEPALRALPFDQLKLRAAWGKAGQQPDALAAVRTYRPEIGQGGTPTLTPDNIGNDDLEPEVGSELEIGFDASLIKGRLGVEFNFYHQKTAQAIVAVPALGSRGFPGNQFRNIGEVSNKGIEVALNASVFRSLNVSVDLGLAYSHNNNEVGSLGGENALSIGNRQFHVQGFPLASMFMRRIVSANIITNAAGRRVADPASLMCEGGQIAPGTTNLSRGGGPAVPCATAPLVYWGQPQPVWEGGAKATVTLWRNLQVFGLVDFSGGHIMSDGDISLGHFLFGNTKAINERRDPVLLGYELLEPASGPQTGIVDAGFAKLRTVSATYTLPNRWIDGLNMSRASITVQADNLSNLWLAQTQAFGVKVVDVETRNTNGTSFSTYNQEGWPSLRRLTTTLRVTF
ncbi:MAG: TonB-dependent receptor domain-containing protein, partial [Longimicrobiales bacterium]